MRRVYVDIMSLPTDSKDTILRVLRNVHKTFIIEQGFRWIIVVGDAKTFDILQNIRREYGSHMQWLLPFPGDWQLSKGATQDIWTTTTSQSCRSSI